MIIAIGREVRTGRIRRLFGREVVGGRGESGARVAEGVKIDFAADFIGREETGIEVEGRRTVEFVFYLRRVVEQERREGLR